MTVDYCELAANVKADVAVDAGLVKRKDEEYLDVRIRLTVGDAKADFANLFNRDPTLSTFVSD